MAAPKWAQMERQLLAENVPAAREFFQKYFDDRGYLLCFVRWGANDGPDDAFENFNHWPELHALGASDEIVQMYLKGHEGMIKQYTEAKTTKRCPPASTGCTSRSSARSRTGSITAKGCSSSTAWRSPCRPIRNISSACGGLPGFYMGEDPDAPNYDPKHNIIRSMMNGSKGPLLRKATSMDWVGEPFDMAGFDALHGERNFDEFLAHYQEYHDVVGDHALNLVATTLPANAYFATGEQKYKQWVDRLRRRMARADEAEQRHHPDLRRPGRQSRRADRQVVGKRVRMGLQPGQSCDEPARESQSHGAPDHRAQQRAAADGRSEVRRRVAQHDQRGERERAHG